MQFPWPSEMWLWHSWVQNEFFYKRMFPTLYKMLSLISLVRPLILDYNQKIHLAGRIIMILIPFVKFVPLVELDSCIYLMLYLSSWSQHIALFLLTFFSSRLDWPPIRNIEPWRWSLCLVTYLLRFGSNVLTSGASF